MDAIKHSISELSLEFAAKLAEFEERQQKLSAPQSPRTGDSRLSEEFSIFKTFTLNSLRALQQQVELLAHQYDNLEMSSRRKILLLHGVPETNGEDTAAVIVELVTRTLKCSVFQAKDIARCHRMGRSSSPDRPRPILFKLRDTALRAELWAAKKSLKGSGITMSEFLTKIRHDAFMAARQRFGVLKCWTRDGIVIVLGQDGVRHRVSCLADLEKLGPGSGQQTSPAVVVTASEGIKAAASSGRLATAAKLLASNDRPSRRVPKLKMNK